MTAPMDNDRLAEIRDRAAWIAEYDVPAEEAERFVLDDVPALLGEMERLRRDSDAQRAAIATRLADLQAILAEALDLRQNRPNGDPAWRAWDRRAERILRADETGR